MPVMFQCNPSERIRFVDPEVIMDIFMDQTLSLSLSHIKEYFFKNAELEYAWTR